MSFNKIVKKCDTNQKVISCFPKKMSNFKKLTKLLKECHSSGKCESVHNNFKRSFLLAIEEINNDFGFEIDQYMEKELNITNMTVFNEKDIKYLNNIDNISNQFIDKQLYKLYRDYTNFLFKNSDMIDDDKPITGKDLELQLEKYEKLMKELCNYLDNKFDSCKF
jgi:hypothetical protein